MHPDSDWHLYRHQVPSFVASELDRLYGTRYACLGHFARCGTLHQASTYVVTEGGQMVTVLLFRQVGAVIAVLNEGIGLAPAQVARFAHAVFAEQRDAAAVVMHLVQVQLPAQAPGQAGRLGWVCQEDLVLPLPANVAAYRASLGASTRDNLKRYVNKLRRQHPAFQFLVQETASVPEAQVRDIIRLNRLRMAGKDKRSSIDAREENDIVAQVRSDGFVGLLLIDGQLAAGVITYRIGVNFNLRILAHAAQFDEHRLGLVCCYWTVCAAIEQQTGGRFYFGWGSEAYKHRLGGRPRQLRRLAVYRSTWHSLRYPGPALGAAAAGFMFWLRGAVRRWIVAGAGVTPPLAARLRSAIRRARIPG